MKPDAEDGNPVHMMIGFGGIYEVALAKEEWMRCTTTWEVTYNSAT